MCIPRLYRKIKENKITERRSEGRGVNVNGGTTETCITRVRTGSQKHEERNTLLKREEGTERGSVGSPETSLQRNNLSGNG